jgi:hypothetical protein
MENGTYRARPVAAALGKAGTGNEQVAIEFEFLDGQGGGITYFGSFTEKAVPHTLKALRTAGWRGDDLADLSSVGGETAPEVFLVIENETYEGRTTAKVKWVNSTGGLALKDPLDADSARAFAAKMRGTVLAHNKGAGVRATPSRGGALPPEPPPLSDEDIPF